MKSTEIESDMHVKVFHSRAVIARAMYNYTVSP